MARLYMDGQFPKVVSGLLRTMGHDVLTVYDLGTKITNSAKGKGKI
jgi:hypothetical protein